MLVFQKVGHVRGSIFSQLRVGRTVYLNRPQEIVEIGVVRDSRYSFIGRRFEHLFVEAELGMWGALEEVLDQRY